MPRLGEEAVQDEIANSLLGEQTQESAEPSPEQQSYFGDQHGDELLSEYHNEKEMDRFRFGDSVAEHFAQREAEQEPSNEERLANLHTDRTDWQAEREREQREEAAEDWKSRMLSPEEARQLAEQQAHGRPEQQQAHGRPEQQQATQESTTPEQVRQQLQGLDFIIEKNQVNDPTANKEFALSMIEVFGGDASQYDSEKLGSMLNKQTLSAALFYDSVGGQLQQFPRVSTVVAREYAYDFLRACNQDPRMLEGKYDQQGLANLAFAVEWSCIDAVAKNPGITDPRQLNRPENCEWGYGTFLKLFGIDADAAKQANPQQFRESALKFGDAKMRHTLSILGRIRAQAGQTQQRQPTRGSRRGIRAPRVPGGRVRGMQTNQDKSSPFNQETIDYYKQQHGRL
jgi:hypothetical protein